MTALDGRTLIRTAAPSGEPLCLDHAKQQLRIVHDEDDGQIERLIAAMRDDLERVSDLALITQSWRLGLDDWWVDSIELPKSPLQSVTEIRYVDTDGVSQILPGTEYAFYPAYRRLAWNPDVIAPELQTGTLQRVEVDYVAGWQSAAEVPDVLRQAMLVNLTTYYDNRGSVDFEETKAYEHLWLRAVEDYL